MLKNRTTDKGSAVLVNIDGNDVPYSEVAKYVDYENMKSLGGALLKIARHYAEEAGVESSTSILFGVKAKDENGKRPVAYEHDRKIFINVEGRSISKFFDDKYDFMNTLVHENKHVVQDHDLPVPIREIEANDIQMSHSSYSKTTAAFQFNTMNLLKDNLNNKYNEIRGTQIGSIQENVMRANKLNSIYNIQLKNYMGMPDMKVIKK